MPDKYTYEFAVIRIVPKVEREEFINIGVIMFSKRKRFLDLKYKIDQERLENFSNHIDVELIATYLKAWDLICKGSKEGGTIAQFEQADRFRWLSSTRSTIIQSSKIHPGLCTKPEETLNELFEMYVS